MRHVVVIAWTCIGCASQSGELDERSASITNGTRADGDPAVVALSLTRSAPHCTGTLIAPRVVLTAGHCISGPMPAAFFGTAPAEGGIWIDGVYAERHPWFYGGPPSVNDLGLILLAEPAPVAPAAVATAALDATFVGAPLRVVGFGSTGGASPITGVKHEGIARVLDFDDTTFRFTGDPSQTCTGDSGAPAFVMRDGAEVLVGVASSGDPQCTTFGRSTRVDYAAGFFASFLELTSAGSAGPGQRCFYAEQCSVGTCEPAPDDLRVRYCATSCTSDADCEAGLICSAEEGLCRFPGPTPGAFGGACDRDADCVDHVCSQIASDAPGLCSIRCIAGEDESCPPSYECHPDFGHSDRSSCFEPEVGGACSAHGSRPADLFGVLLASLLASRRRRRR